MLTHVREVLQSMDIVGNNQCIDKDSLWVDFTNFIFSQGGEVIHKGNTTSHTHSLFIEFEGNYSNYWMFTSLAPILGILRSDEFKGYILSFNPSDYLISVHPSDI